MENKNTISSKYIQGKNKKGNGISVENSTSNSISKNKVNKLNCGIYIKSHSKTNSLKYNVIYCNKFGLASNYVFKNRLNLFKGNNWNFIKI